MRIEDSNKDNYKQNSEQFDHKCNYIVQKWVSAICVQLGAGKPAGALCWWVLSIHGPVAMNTACMFSIHSPDNVFMAR